jgi:hypothetical protein
MTVIRSALKLYIKTGMKVNRMYTPANMVQAVAQKTGKQYKRGKNGMILKAVKPSKNEVIQAIKRGITKGHYQFEIAWGENMVTLEKGRAGVIPGSAGAGSRIYQART